MTWTLPAKGHMPFPGHRTCGEWDRPVSAKHERAKPAPPPPKGPSEAERLARCANVPLHLAQLVVYRANQYGVRLGQLRAEGASAVCVKVRRMISKQARREGFSYPQIGRALNRDHSSIINLINGRARP